MDGRRAQALQQRSLDTGRWRGLRVPTHGITLAAPQRPSGSLRYQMPANTDSSSALGRPCSERCWQRAGGLSCGIWGCKTAENTQKGLSRVPREEGTESRFEPGQPLCCPRLGASFPACLPDAGDMGDMSCPLLRRKQLECWHVLAAQRTSQCPGLCCGQFPWLPSHQTS